MRLLRLFVLGQLVALAVAQSTPHLAGAQTPPDAVGDPPASRRGGLSADVVEGEILVKFKPGTSGQEMAAAHRQHGGQIRSSVPRIDVQVVQVPAGQESASAAAYARDPNVKFAEVNAVYRVIATTSDPRVAEQWQYHNTGQTGGAVDADIDAFEAWDVTSGSSSVAIAVLDSGIDQSHEDLRAKTAKNVNFSASVGAEDKVGHGTHVAGSAAAITNNQRGVAGTCPNCTLYNVKVVGDDGRGSGDSVANGIIWAVDNGAQVVNLSLGGYVPSATLEQAVNYAWERGVVVVAGAGNDNVSTPFYPAAYPNVIAVASTDHNDARSSFSNYGPWVDVAAPGSAILSTAPDHSNSIFLFGVGYGTISGTSMATPHVAGLAGLIWSTGLCGAGDNDCVRQRIEQRADPIGGTGNYWAEGRINAHRSVLAGAAPPRPPVVNAISPTSGPGAGGTTVTITGSGFSTQVGGTIVRFGPAEATGVSCDSATSCTAVAPAGTGAVHVTVTAGGATSLTGSHDLYTYVLPPCTAASSAVSPTSPQPPGTAVTFTASATGCTSPEYRFWMLPPGGSWQVVGEWGTSPTFAWATGGLKNGTYKFSTWVRQVGNAAEYETFVETTYLLSFPPCTAATASTSPAPPQPPGPSVTFTAAANGCSSPEYRFWVLPPGGGWQVAREWGASPNWTWATAGQKTGSYKFSIWVRQTGNSADYETFAEVGYALQIPPCSAASLGVSPASPQPPGASVAFSASASGCATPEYRFWVLPPGGSWQVAREWSTDPNWTWVTTGQKTGSYKFSIWVRAVGNTANYETFAETGYLLSLPPCTGASMAVSPASPQPPGDSVSFAPAASGCAAPEYRFWMLPPGGGWQVAREWGASPNWTWATAGQKTGSYKFSIWVRQTGNSADYETFAETTYVLALPPCGSGAVSANPASPQPPGTGVTFNGSATGCATPEYRFWMLPPGGAWQVVREWGTGSAWTWATAGQKTGAYKFSVWIRQVGSSANYETFGETTYTLTFPQCTKASVSASPASPQAPGTAVTLAVSATGCAAPEYRFWMLPPGGGWQVAREWGASPNWTWATAGQKTGSYKFSIWVRQVGNTGSYDTFVETTYALEATTTTVLTTETEVAPAPAEDGRRPRKKRVPRGPSGVE